MQAVQNIYTVKSSQCYKGSISDVVWVVVFFKRVLLEEKKAIYSDCNYCCLFSNRHQDLLDTSQQYRENSTAHLGR